MMNHLESENSNTIEPSFASASASVTEDENATEGRHRTFEYAEHRMPAITVALVERVSQRVAKGIPLDLALAGESVTEEDYKEQLERNPDFAAIEGKAKRKFIEDAVSGLLRAENPSANIRWLLERIYPDVFGKPGGDREQDEVEEAKPKQTIAGIPEWLLEESRRRALLL